jgi:CheY-like chemotaxis protein
MRDLVPMDSTTGADRRVEKTRAGFNPDPVEPHHIGAPGFRDRPRRIVMQRILLFDDSPLSLEIHSEVLRRVGFEVRGSTALADFDRLLVGWRPDIILTDVRMPEIDGASLCRVLKSRPETSDVPIVLFSSLSDTELAAMAGACGADAYVVKTVSAPELAERIRGLCEQILW